MESNTNNKNNNCYNNIRAVIQHKRFASIVYTLKQQKSTTTTTTKTIFAYAYANKQASMLTQAFVVKEHALMHTRITVQTEIHSYTTT